MDSDEARQRESASDPSQWLDQHGDALFRYAMLHLGDRAAAEDAVQDTLLAALSARKDFAGRSSERTWLVGILKHKVIDHLRKSSREQSVVDLDATTHLVSECFNPNGKWNPGPHNWGRNAAASLEPKEFWDVFRFCVSRLPPLLAGAFLMRETGELATEEICKLLKVTATNLWTMLHRARTRLRSCLETNWFDRNA